VPRTVLSIVSTLGRTGPINVLKGIVRHYDPSRYRCVVVTLSPEGSNSQLDEFVNLGLPVNQLNLSRVRGFIDGRRKLTKLACETGASIIHCHGFRATRLAAHVEFKSRALASVVSDIDVDYRLAYGPVLGRLMASAEYSALRNFRSVVSCSISAKEALERHGIGSAEILNGIEVAKFRMEDGQAAVARKRAEFSWDPQNIVILHTGILMERKRPLDVIAAFQKSKLAGIGKLVFAGDGPLMNECQFKAGGAPNIVFLGMRKDIQALLYGADCLVSASASEGMPMALLEGIASGIHLAISDIPAHRQLRDLFPSNVQTFGLGDINDLARQLDEMACQGRLGRTFPPMEELNPISDTRMSESYQVLYDRM
jgi:glycosyltransferase involved in cell wall biosynthesis